MSILFKSVAHIISICDSVLYMSSARKQHPNTVFVNSTRERAELAHIGEERRNFMVTHHHPLLMHSITSHSTYFLDSILSITYFNPSPSIGGRGDGDDPVISCPINNISII